MSRLQKNKLTFKWSETLCHELPAKRKGLAESTIGAVQIRMHFPVYLKEWILQLIRSDRAAALRNSSAKDFVNVSCRCFYMARFRAVNTYGNTKPFMKYSSPASYTWSMLFVDFCSQLTADINVYLQQGIFLQGRWCSYERFVSWI